MQTTQSAATAKMITELQSFGIRLADPKAGAASRRGGAGPSDHKAVTIDGVTVMVPIHTAGAFESPYSAAAPDADGNSEVTCEGRSIGRISFPPQPRFYGLSTADGVPYSKIATLHGRDVLATTILQTCIRYQSRTKTCQFCAIGQSLAAGRTIAHKTPQQLAEVAKAAVELDGVRHMVMTTGTPNATDRGAAILCDSARAIKAAVPLPIQGQCEPPDDDIWFEHMRDAGIDTLGMHLEVVTPELRARIMPGKASVPVERYMTAFETGFHLYPRRTWRYAGGSAGYIRAADCDRRLSLHRALRADIGNAARRSSLAQPGVHGVHPRTAGANAEGWGAGGGEGEGGLRQMRRLLGTFYL
jgi:radical SAM protein (TIGR04043 family)